MTLNVTHQMPSNLMQNCTDGALYCLSKWANTVTYGNFWLFMLIGFTLVIYFGTVRWGTTRAFGFSSFVGMLGAIWLVIMNLLAWYYASAFILVGFIGIVSLILNEK